MIDIERATVGRSRGRTLVVLIPGLGEHPSHWMWIAPKLIAAGIDVGHLARIPTGHNDDGKRVFSVVEAGQLLIKEVERLGYTDVHLVAHSVGTFVALEALSAAPAALFKSTLVLNGGLHTVGRFLERPLATLMTDVRLCARSTYLFILLGVPAPRAFRKAVVRYGWPLTVLLRGIVSTPALANAQVRRSLITNGGNPDIFLALWRNRRQWERVIEFAPSIDAPVQFIAGDQDGLASVRDTEALAALLPNASVKVLPGVGHAAPLEAPADVLTAIACQTGMSLDHT